MGGSEHEQHRRAARDLLVELAAELTPAQRAVVVGDEDQLARLYALRDQARCAGLGPAGVAVAAWIGRATTLLRDEADHQQARQLLHRAADQLTTLAREGSPGPGEDHRPPAGDPIPLGRARTGLARSAWA